MTPMARSASMRCPTPSREVALAVKIDAIRLV